MSQFCGILTGLNLKMSRMRVILLLWLPALLTLTNGMIMLFMPHIWYELTPGVTKTGPENDHFIGDVGLVFTLVAGTTMYTALNLHRPHVAYPILSLGVIYLTMHSVFHAVTWVFFKSANEKPMQFVNDLLVYFHNLLHAIPLIPSIWDYLIKHGKQQINKYQRVATSS